MACAFEPNLHSDEGGAVRAHDEACCPVSMRSNCSGRDEPSLGLAPNITQEVFRTVRELNDSGLTVLLVEQDAYAALRISRRGYVLEMGRVALEGNCGELRRDPRIQEAYLGS